ncbi:tetratricopeptide repeat protein [Sphingomonas adhaesiva]|uniref:tetratricopeptide repeat protein n=1 Tax=Sphingomonas adhaesiva TaxID=28212 RepID=UPI002FF9C6F8
MRTMIATAMVAAAAMVAVPAAAKDRTGYRAIAAGDFAQAQATLAQERAIFPDRPELMLNQAAVFARTGRAAEARVLYGEVMARQPVALDLPDGSVASSHTVAQRGMARLAATMASR